jgi:hypothetical protein
MVEKMVEAGRKAEMVWKIAVANQRGVAAEQREAAMSQGEALAKRRESTANLREDSTKRGARKRQQSGVTGTSQQKAERRVSTGWSGELN